MAEKLFNFILLIRKVGNLIYFRHLYGPVWVWLIVRVRPLCGTGPAGSDPGADRDGPWRGRDAPWLRSDACCGYCKHVLRFSSRFTFIFRICFFGSCCYGICVKDFAGKNVSAKNIKLKENLVSKCDFQAESLIPS